MSYSIMLTMFWLLCARGVSGQGESNANDTFHAQGINHAAVDFHSQTSVVKSTSDSSGDGIDIVSRFIWKPFGRQRNEIKSESVLRYFKYDNGSGGDDLQPRIEAPKELGIWTVNETTEEKLETTTQRPKILQDRKRKVAEEKAYLIYERRLRKTNWCFKENDNAKRNYKFKKTEGCCQRHKECQARRHVKRGIHECSCDIYFHLCLRKVHTKMAKSIEKMYFKRNIICYRKNSGGCADEPCANVIYVWKIIPAHPK